jgi:hypothetical protein
VTGVQTCALPISPGSVSVHGLIIAKDVDAANIARYFIEGHVDTVYMEVLMRILYLYDRDEPDRREAGSALAAWAEKRGHELRLMPALSLKPCLGCFGCWVKTPGRCVVTGDEWDRVVESLYRSDLVVLAGATPYGCFAPPIKAVLDRAIALLLPYFRIFRGETHHIPRYARLPRIVSAAFDGASRAEDETYLELVRSFCDNIASPRQKSLFRYRGDALPLISWLEEELAS